MKNICHSFDAASCGNKTTLSTKVYRLMKLLKGQSLAIMNSKKITCTQAPESDHLEASVDLSVKKNLKQPNNDHENLNHSYIAMQILLIMMALRLSKMKIFAKKLVQIDSLLMMPISKHKE